MIDPNWQLADLDPYTWRAIGKFIDPAMYIRAGSPDENGLYIVHDVGRVLSVVETSGARRSDLGIDRVSNPKAVAAKYFEQGIWDRVHVIDRRHLAKVSASAQQLPNRDLELDAYYRNVFDLIWGDDDGYVVLPPHPGTWNGWGYQQIVDVVNQLQEPASLALGVVDDIDGSLIIGLLGEVSEGSFQKVTTFESLPFDRSDVAITSEFLDRLWNVLAESDFPPAAVLLCTESVFEKWIDQPNKTQTIDSSVVANLALLRVREVPPLLW